jgi:hypothetical protein
MRKDLSNAATFRWAVGFAVFMVGCLTIQTCRAERALDEAMGEREYATTYRPLRDAGQKALAEGRHLDAAGKFLAAADATAFRIVRARHLANAALAYLSAGRVGIGEFQGQGVDEDPVAMFEKSLSLVASARTLLEDSKDGHGVTVDGLTKDLEDMEGMAKRKAKSLKGSK